MCVSKKAFQDILTLPKERGIFQSKASREKMNTSEMSNSTLTNPKVGLVISE